MSGNRHINIYKYNIIYLSGIIQMRENVDPRQEPNMAPKTAPEADTIHVNIMLGKSHRQAFQGAGELYQSFVGQSSMGSRCSVWLTQS